MEDESRRALRNLARRAEWSGRAGAAGAAQDARALQELGRGIEAMLAPEPDRSTWGYAAAEQLAGHCRRARPDWSVEQIAELSRLRDEAVIALAPGPGETDEAPDEGRRAAARGGGIGSGSGRNHPAAAARLGISTLASRRPAVIALAVVGGLVLAAAILIAPHLLSGDSSGSATVSATTVAPASPTTATATDAPTESVPASPSATESAPALSSSSPTLAPSSGPASTSRVTSLQISPEPQQGYPEVILTGAFTTSGTGDVTITVTVSGGSGQPEVTQIDDSGQTSYNLTQTIYLNQWCGQSSVLLTVSSGSISKSATVPVSGC